MESHYMRSLEKARQQDLKNVRYLNKYQGAILTGLSPNKFKELGERVGARIKIGNAIRYDKEIILDALETQRSK